jgi:hypothetical protein
LGLMRDFATLPPLPVSGVPPGQARAAGQVPQRAAVLDRYGRLAGTGWERGGWACQGDSAKSRLRSEACRLRSGCRDNTALWSVPGPRLSSAICTAITPPVLPTGPKPCIGTGGIAAWQLTAHGGRRVTHWRCKRAREGRNQQWVHTTTPWGRSMQEAASGGPPPTPAAPSQASCSTQGCPTSPSTPLNWPWTQSRTSSRDSTWTLGPTRRRRGS